MAKVPHPHTAYNIKQYLCTLEHIGHYNHTELYGRMSDNEPYNDNDHVDLHHVGTTKRHPIALVKSSDKHVDIPRGSTNWNVSNNVNVQPAFTRKLVAKYTCGEFRITSTEFYILLSRNYQTGGSGLRQSSI